MMNACDKYVLNTENAINEFILKVQKELPDRCSVQDLIAAGIFNSPAAAFEARNRHDSPPFFRLRGRIMYPKNGVIRWLGEKKEQNIKELVNE